MFNVVHRAQTALFRKVSSSHHLISIGDENPGPRGKPLDLEQVWQEQVGALF
jgi:hypothetical protein